MRSSHVGLKVQGTDDSELVTVSPLGSNKVLVTGSFLPGGAKVFNKNGIDGIEIYAFGGNDTVIVAHYLSALIDGGAGRGLGLDLRRRW